MPESLPAGRTGALAWDLHLDRRRARHDVRDDDAHGEMLPSAFDDFRSRMGR